MAKVLTDKLIQVCISSKAFYSLFFNISFITRHIID